MLRCNFKKIKSELYTSPSPSPFIRSCLKQRQRGKQVKTKRTTTSKSSSYYNIVPDRGIFFAILNMQMTFLRYLSYFSQKIGIDFSCKLHEKAVPIFWKNKTNVIKLSFSEFAQTSYTEFVSFLQ